MSTAGPSGRAVVVVLLCLLTGAAAGCGVGLDDRPRSIEQPQSTSTTVPLPVTGVVDSTLYFVRDGMLMPVLQEVPDASIASDVTALIKPGTEVGQRYGLTSSFPSGTKVLGVEQSGSRVTVDLSSDFDNVVGLARQQAIGQMVLTVTEHDSIRSLAFEVDGRPLPVSSPARGDRLDVTACDYATLLATPDQALDAGLPAAAIQRLEDRNDDLRSCASGG